MSKSSPNAAVGAKTTEAATATSRKSPHGSHHDASRETFESIAFAFVLALLFRTFVAEAFVIPTGSMAPTLFGRNKDVVCEECHYHYQVGASDELNDDGYLVRRIDDSLCPNCRHQNKIRDLLAFKGDRILVNKFPYQLGEPQRWDVIVFRYPEDPQKNYIKRLVGLPGEAIKISRGDVYARKDDQGEYQILRKQNPDKQKVLQQLVYDDRYPPVDLLAKGWPERWAAMRPSTKGASSDKWETDEQSWKHDAKVRSFSIESSEDMKWVRYQHLIPQRSDWSSAGETHQQGEPRPELITDFCGYNAYSNSRSPGFDDDRFWVGDLTLNCTVDITEVKGPNAELVLELVEGVRRYRCQIDVSTGTATLLRNDDLSADSYLTDVVMASAPTPIRGPGKYTLAFANVDDRLCFWVNSSWLRSGLIPFGPGAEFTAPANRNPQPGDLNPAGFAATGITAKVSDLLLQRDIYYRSESVPNSGYESAHEQEVPEIVRMRDSLTNPTEYGDLYARKSREATFRAMSSDEFFVMGDNSPRSQDSRLWSNSRHAVNRHAVPRQALLGKAFFIYWPHGIPFLNNGHGFKILNHSPYLDQMGKPIVDTYPEYVFPFYPQWWRWSRIR